MTVALAGPIPPLTCGSGPKGIRTPDLLAASQNGLSGVLPSIFAGRERAKQAKLCAEKMTSRRGRFSLEGDDVVLPWGTLEDVRIEIVFEVDVGLPRQLPAPRQERAARRLQCHFPRDLRPVLRIEHQDLHQASKHRPGEQPPSRRHGDRQHDQVESVLVEIAGRRAAFECRTSQLDGQSPAL